MAQNTTKNVGTAWTELTDANVTTISFQNKSKGSRLLVAGTTGSAPSDDTGAIEYGAGLGEANAALNDLWPGISATRVFAKSEGPTIPVYVSHA